MRVIGRCAALGAAALFQWKRARSFSLLMRVAAAAAVAALFYACTTCAVEGEQPPHGAHMYAYELSYGYESGPPCRQDAECVAACGIDCVSECCREEACMQRVEHLGVAPWKWPVAFGQACYKRCTDSCQGDETASYAGVENVHQECIYDASVGCGRVCGKSPRDTTGAGYEEIAPPTPAALLAWDKCYLRCTSEKSKAEEAQLGYPQGTCLRCSARVGIKCLEGCEREGSGDSAATVGCMDRCNRERMPTDCVVRTPGYVFDTETGGVVARDYYEGEGTRLYKGCSATCTAEAEAKCGYTNAQGSFVDALGCFERERDECVWVMECDDETQAQPKGHQALNFSTSASLSDALYDDAGHYTYGL